MPIDRPLPPEVLAASLQDRIHPASGRLLKSSSILDFADSLRSRGIKSYKGDFEGKTVELELGPAVVPDPPKSNEDPIDVCNCKCPTYAHVNGFCINGCEPSACIETEK